MKKLLAVIFAFSIVGLAQQPAQPSQTSASAPEAALPESVEAKREVVLEYALRLSQIEAARQRAAAKRLEAQLEENRAERLGEMLQPLLDDFLKSQKLDPNRYERHIEEQQGRIYFTLKKPPAQPEK
ncbi:MAG TPA: hypothetical protein VJ464_30695 [Blastocatellia bacterium]|nr:hypothetical protein [Blastocatellia bacterium]